MKSPALAAIVLSMGPRSTVVDAVASLVRQDEPCEIVVIHSGGGDVTSLLTSAGLNVNVVVAPQALLPGGARNLGVRSTVAPYVAFLADDCVALDGWARLRREHHDAGHDAVASALVSHRPRRPVALAAHLSLFVNRMPRTPPELALRYSASYRRSALDRLGPFRDDVRGGEDSEFNARLGAPDQIVWDPRIVTAHHGSERFGQVMRDHTMRGRRMVRSRIELGDGMAGRVARDSVLRTVTTLRQSVRVVSRRDWIVLLFAVPVIIAAGLAYGYGAHRESRHA